MFKTTKMRAYIVFDPKLNTFDHTIIKQIIQISKNLSKRINLFMQNDYTIYNPSIFFIIFNNLDVFKFPLSDRLQLYSVLFDRKPQ